MANLYLAIFFVNNASINAIVGKLLDLFVMETIKNILFLILPRVWYHIDDIHVI